MAGKVRRIRALAGVVAIVVVLLLSHRFGRAEPTADYRPDVPPEALATGCFPLPGGAELSFAYQVRRDGDVEIDGEMRRRLIGQYDEIDEDEALAAIVADFTEVGFVASQRPAPPYDAVLRQPDGTRQDVVRVMVEQLPGIEEDTLVRGTFELDLPVVAVQKDDEVCDDPRATKRWDDEA